MKAIVVPLALKRRFGDAVSRLQGYRLILQTYADTTERPFCSRYVRPVLRVMWSMTAERHGRLCTLVFDVSLREQGWRCGLSRRTGSRCMHAKGSLARQETREDVEPVDSKIVKNDVINVVERCIHDPIVIEVDREVCGHNVTDLPSANRVSEIAEVRCPPPVLVDSKFDTRLLGLAQRGVFRRPSRVRTVSDSRRAFWR